MSDRIQVGHLYPTAKPIGKSTARNAALTAPSVPFHQLFKEQLQNQELKFSSHASERMKSRGIQLNSVDMDKLNSAVDQAAEKGSKDSLVLLNNVAYVVSVKNKTVVTAVDSSSMQNHLFTQIDSAIIL
jgi:flagellar operon protein